MEAPLSTLFDFYQHPTGRRLFAHGQTLKQAAAAKLPDVVKHCTAAIAHDRKCLALERRWAGVAAAARGKGPAAALPAGSPATLKIDATVDRTLTAIRDHAVNQTAGAPPDDPIHITVAGFLKELFPTTVQDVTGLPFVEELAAVEHILTQLQGKDALQPIVEDLALHRQHKHLAALTDQYRNALQTPTPETLAFGQVRAARAEGQDRLLQTVAIVAGKFFRNTPDDAAARAALLGPILEQQEAIGAAMRGRRVIEDVNPETGEPDPNASAPVPAAPTPGGESEG